MKEKEKKAKRNEAGAAHDLVKAKETITFLRGQVEEYKESEKRLGGRNTELLSLNAALEAKVASLENESIPKLKAIYEESLGRENTLTKKIEQVEATLGAEIERLKYEAVSQQVPAEGEMSEVAAT